MERVFQFFLLILLLCDELIISYSSVAATEKNSGLLKSDDESSLAALKSLITSDPHNILKKNWSTKASVCSWVGVTCDSRHRRVTQLDISYMQLVGRIPPEIGNMSSLVSVDMSWNFFHGPIPPSIFNMSSLESIILRNNRLSGRLSSEICSHNLRRQLRVLDLSMNKFYGEIPLSLHQCSQLEEIDLSYNYFGGAVPTQIGNITLLKYLSLGGNNLTGTIPEQIGNLNNLEVLSMGSNKLSGSLPRQIWNITTLTTISFLENSLTVLKDVGHEPTRARPPVPVPSSDLDICNWTFGGLWAYVGFRGLAVSVLRFINDRVSEQVDGSLFRKRTGNNRLTGRCTKNGQVVGAHAGAWCWTSTLKGCNSHELRAFNCVTATWS